MPVSIRWLPSTLMAWIVPPLRTGPVVAAGRAGRMPRDAPDQAAPDQVPQAAPPAPGVVGLAARPSPAQGGTAGTGGQQAGGDQPHGACANQTASLLTEAPYQDRAATAHSGLQLDERIYLSSPMGARLLLGAGCEAFRQVWRADAADFGSAGAHAIVARRALDFCDARQCHNRRNAVGELAAQHARRSLRYDLPHR